MDELVSEEENNSISNNDNDLSNLEFEQRKEDIKN